MNNLKAIYHKKSKVIELYEGDRLLKEEIVHEPEDWWFGAKIGRNEYDFNLFENKIGMYNCYKEKGHWKTGEFEGEVPVEIK